MSTGDLEALASSTVSRRGIPPAQLAREIAPLGARWAVAGDDLQLVLAGAMSRTAEAALHAAKLADELDHHPRIVIEYGKLTLGIHTHDVKAITILDLVYAARLEQWLRDHGWPA